MLISLNQLACRHMWQAHLEAHHPAHSHTRQNSNTHTPHLGNTLVTRSSPRTSQHVCGKHTCSDPRSIRPTPALALGTLRARAAARARSYYANLEGCPFSVSAPSQSSTPLSERHSPPSARTLSERPLFSERACPLGAAHTFSERHSNRENFLILTHDLR